jgi:hypothetical protein
MNRNTISVRLSPAGRAALAVAVLFFLAALPAWAASPTTTVSFGQVSSVAVEIRWSYKSGYPSYEIYRSIGTAGTYDQVGVKTNVGGSADSTYLDSNGIQPETEYCYKVLVCTEDGSNCSRLEDTAHRYAQTPALPHTFTISGYISEQNGIDLSGVTVDLSWFPSSAWEPMY